jgi:hypothetical protein
MYIAAALCAWFLRAWKIREEQRVEEELQRKKEEAGARLHGGDGDGPVLRRHASRVSTIQKVRGFWAWERV